MKSDELKGIRVIDLDISGPPGWSFDVENDSAVFNGPKGEKLTMTVVECMVEEESERSTLLSEVFQKFQKIIDGYMKDPGLVCEQPLSKESRIQDFECHVAKAKVKDVDGLFLLSTLKASKGMVLITFESDSSEQSEEVFYSFLGTIKSIPA